jgi:hypothetical protein
MKKLFIYTAIICSLTGCSKDKLTASGDKITEDRQPGTFTGVSTSGSTPVHLSYGTDFKVTLKGSNNLIPYFKTKVSSGVLFLNYEKASVQHDDIEVFITLPMINSVSISGDSEVDLAGQFPTIENLKVSISGSGEIMATENLTAKQLNIDISGSGDAELGKLSTKKADIDLSGSGKVKLSVEEVLKVRISGSGEVRYLGNPEIDQKISGFGKLIKL